jgi:hypothetical protein
MKYLYKNKIPLWSSSPMCGYVFKGNEVGTSDTSHVLITYGGKWKWWNTYPHWGHIKHFSQWQTAYIICHINYVMRVTAGPPWGWVCLPFWVTFFSFICLLGASCGCFACLTQTSMTASLPLKLITHESVYNILLSKQNKRLCHH